jgi:hypothetical protein
MEIRRTGVVVITEGIPAYIFFTNKVFWDIMLSRWLKVSRYLKKIVISSK